MRLVPHFGSQVTNHSGTRSYLAVLSHHETKAKGCKGGLGQRGRGGQCGDRGLIYFMQMSPAPEFECEKAPETVAVVVRFGCVLAHHPIHRFGIEDPAVAELFGS
jgi:hypothetical protein